MSNSISGSVIGASGSALPASPGSGSTAALEGQIARDQVNLADWASCVSAKTPKGKAQIAAISARISAAKARIRKIEDAQRAASIKAGAPRSSDSVQAPSGSSNANRTHWVRGQLDVWA